MRENQAGQLKTVIDRARRAPFYAERLRDIDASEWTNIPFTTKEDLRAAYPYGLLAAPRESLATYHESSGTSGKPTSTFFTESDWDDIASRFSRNAVDLRPSDTVLIKTPYSMVTTAHQMHRAARARGALVVPADNRSSNMPYSKVVRLLKDLAVTVAWCMPSEALIWAKAAKAAGLDPALDFPSFRAFLVAGEPMSPARKRRISETWGITSVFEDYGSTETGSLAGECSKGHLHAWSDRVHFEIASHPRDKATTSTGEGWLVVTPLHREGQPLVRYFIGDRVSLSEERCDCGSPHPIIRVLGRPESMLKIAGRELSPVGIEDVVYGLPAEFGTLFWRARPEGDRLCLEIDHAEGYGNAAAHALGEGLYRRFGVASEIRSAPAEAFLAERQLTDPGRFLKPRFVFREGEPWEQGLNY